MVNGGGVSPDLATLSPYFWNVIPLVDFELKAMTAWLKQRGLKKLALVYVDDPLGNGILTQLQADLPGIGGSLARQLQHRPQRAGIFGRCRQGPGSAARRRVFRKLWCAAIADRQAIAR